MVGFSNNIGTASKFGDQHGGFTINIKFDFNDIIINRDMLSWITNMHNGEEDFIIINGKYAIPKEKIFLPK